jgi:hypothetical protein
VDNPEAATEEALLHRIPWAQGAWVPHTPPPSAARQPMTQVDEALARAEELLGTLNAKREELERMATADDLDGDAAVDLIAELADLARQIEAELTRARGLADATG